MEARSLGRTGLRVSRVGLGLAALGRPGYVTLGHAVDLGPERSMPALEARTHAVLDAALASGITYLDAARSYGRAEAFLAAWLRERGLPRGAVTVGTKWGYTYTAGWRTDAAVHEVKDHSLAALRRQWEESRSVLGDDRIDLLQVHSATTESGILEDASVHAALAELRESGAVRGIGLTLSGTDQAETLRRATAIEVDGVRLFDTVQATWNALEPSIGPGLAAAHREGIGVIVKEALANGRLVRGAEAEVLRPHAARLGVEADALAIAHALEQPWADLVLSGAATVEQLAANLRAVDLALDGPARAALAALAEPAEAYWRRRRSLTWS